MKCNKKRDIEEQNKYQTLTKKHIIRKASPYYQEIDNLCFLSKNLYNSTLYTIRQHYFATKEYLSYFKVAKLFAERNQVDYRALPAKVARQTQLLVDNNFTSFFKLLEKKNKGEYNKKVRIPAYLDKVKGRQVVSYSKDALSFKKKGFIKLSKTNIYIETDLSKEVILMVRLVPRNCYYVIEIVYEVLKTEELDKTGRYASIDLGVNNLITVSSNVCDPIIINGKPLKSINEFYNKKIAKLKSEVMKCQGLYTSKKIQNLFSRRKFKVDDYMHKASRMLVNHLVSNNIDTLIIGENKGWKQDIDIGTKNNRIFVSIPLDTLKQLIKYKCEMEGIEVLFTEESYTSKASFLDNDVIPVYKLGKINNCTFSGKRIKRGLYQTQMKKVVNSDLNGAANIMKKHLIKNKVWNRNISEEVKTTIYVNPKRLNVI